MRKDIRRRHDAHVRVNGVCTEHSAVFDATSGGQATCAALSTSVADVDRLLAVQERALADKRASAVQCRAARRALRNTVNAIVRVGKLVNVGDVPMGTMQIPGAMSDEQLLAYTRGLLDRVSPVAEAFVAEGLPADFLTTLAKRIQGLTTAREALRASGQRSAAAAASIRESQDQASKTVAAIEAIAINTPAANPEVAMLLRMAKRIGPRADAAPKAPPTPAPSPAPPPTPPTDKAA